MKQLFLLIIFSLFRTAAYAEASPCSLELFSKIYRLEADAYLSKNDIVRSSDCDSNILNKITQIISNSTGSIGVDFLKKEIEKDFPLLDINITPRKISLLDINSIFHDQLTAGSNFFFLNSKSLNGLKSLGLIEGEQIKMVCDSCTTFGEKNIKIDINNSLTNSNRTLWFTSRVMAKVRVFKAKRNLSFQQKHLNPEDFYADDVFTSSPENLVTTLENIHFYKVNKTILQGSAVSNLDLQSINLVNFGVPVQVVLKNQNISLQRTALPTRSALFGETIELKNPNNNKTIAGKVIDYNKVVIEL